MQKQISSVQNPAVKKLLQLQEKSRVRRKEKLFIIEGKREISLALKGGYEIKELYYCPELISSEEVNMLLSEAPSSKKREQGESGSDQIEISSEVYEKLAYRGGTEGILAVARAKDLRLENLSLPNENPLLLIAEAPEKPGNIGALLRTADAANVDAVLIANPKTDMFNPNIIRSSVGCVFTNRIAIGSTEEIIQFLQNNHVNIYGAALQASVPYHTVDFTAASAIVVGTEATGLSAEWLSNTSQNIIIPMQGEIDSMNVSVAAGILIFEAKRQRKFR